MPVITRPIGYPKEFREKTEAIEHVLRNPNAPGPIIIENELVNGQTAVVVVWDGWHPLDARLRPKAIIEAYREARGDEAAARLTAPLGLSIADAQMLGVDFEP